MAHLVPVDWTPAFNTPAGMPLDPRSAMLASLREMGIEFIPPINTADWGPSLAKWPTGSADAEMDVIDIADTLWKSLGVCVNVGSWMTAQFQNPYSIMVTLSEMPGMVYYANGGTYGRGALGPFAGVTAEKWLVVPNPLQLIDAKKGLMWHLIGAGDFYEAASQLKPGVTRLGTELVNTVSRTGAVIPGDYWDRTNSLAVDGYTSFWATLESRDDWLRQDWPHNGLDYFPE